MRGSIWKRQKAIFVLFCFKLFYYCSSTVVCIPPDPAILTSFPWFHLALGLSLSPLQLFLKTPPHFPPIIPSHLPSGYCQFVLNFNVSSYFACLFVLLIRFHLKVRSYGICLSPPGLFSLSLMLSNFIHAVTKGRSSFFLLHRIPLCKCIIAFWSTHLLMGTWVASSTWLL